jgi:hypothetical protein
MRRSGRCKGKAGQGSEAFSARRHRVPLTALGFASSWRRKLATHLLRKGVASDIRRHCLRQPLQLSKSGNPTAF